MLALKLGHTLNKCVNIVIAKGIEAKNKDLQVKVEKLAKLIKIDWTDKVSSNALRTLNDAKCNSKSNLLPLAADIKLLVEYLRCEAKCNVEILNSPNDQIDVIQAWNILFELTLS